MCCCIQLCVERIVGAHGMINYVDARTAWMDDIVKQAQWQGITQVNPNFVQHDVGCSNGTWNAPHMQSVL